MALALPVTLAPDILPRAELGALVLDGLLWRVDRTFHSVDEPDRPGLRADAIHRMLLYDLGRRVGSADGGPPRQRSAYQPGEPGVFLAAGLSAAWVHGALPAPPRVHDMLARAPARVPVPALPQDWRVSQARVRDGDICLRGGWPVLTELATALALAQRLIGTASLPDEPVARDVHIRALTALVRLTGLTTVHEYLSNTRSRRGTRAHEARELIGRIARNLEQDSVRRDRSIPLTEQKRSSPRRHPHEGGSAGLFVERLST